MSADYQQWEIEKAPLTKEEIQRMMAQGCTEPGCTSKHDELMFLTGVCHPRGKIDVALFHGSLYISCRICDSFIARFQVIPEVVQ